MKKIIFGLLTALVMTISCTPKNEVTDTTIPPGVIPPDSMTQVITEMQVTEAILREFKRRGSHDEDRVVVFYNQTFENLGITPERYKKSLAFYEEHQETYYEIYKDVISRLTEMQTEITNSK